MQRIGLVVSAVLAVAMMAWPATAEAGDDCVHTVKSGQTLGHIANRHGVSQRDLIDSNPELRKNPDMLRVGQELDVCAAKKLSGKSVGKSGRATKKSRAKKCGGGGIIVAAVHGDGFANAIKLDISQFEPA